MMMRSTTVITKWVYSVVRVTLVWWIANFPFLYLIFAAFGVKNGGQFGTLVLTGLALVPFVLVPGTIGALGVGRDTFKHENDFPLLSTFLKYYKREYVNGVKVGVVFMVTLSVFYMGYSYYSRLLGTTPGLVFILFIFAAIFYFIFLLTILVDRTNSMIGYFVVTAQLLSRHPVLMITLIIETLLVIYLCATMMPSLLVFVVPGIIVLLATHFYIQCLKQEEKKDSLITEES
jgi:uncharacterized membrane protein YesL